MGPMHLIPLGGVVHSKFLSDTSFLPEVREFISRHFEYAANCGCVRRVPRVPPPRCMRDPHTMTQPHTPLCLSACVGDEDSCRSPLSGVRLVKSALWRRLGDGLVVEYGSAAASACGCIGNCRASVRKTGVHKATG